MKPDEIVKKKLSLIKLVPARDPEKAARGREVFMNKVEELQTRKSNQVVTPKQTVFTGLGSFRRSFASLTVALLLALAVILGGTWGTVYAAQSSLPGDFLYNVKLFDENIHLTFAGSPEAKIELLNTYADRRIDEALELASLGHSVPETLLAQVEAQFDAMFILAANMDNAAMAQALSGIQNHLRDQDRLMTNAMTGLPEGLDPQLTRLQSMLQARQQMAASGIETPHIFQYQFRNQENKPVLDVTETITPTLGISPTVTNTVPMKSTVTPGQYGPGPCETPGDCVAPGDGPGPGPFEETPMPPQDQQGYGPGSDQGMMPETPTPKQGEGQNSSSDPKH